MSLNQNYLNAYLGIATMISNINAKISDLKHNQEAILAKMDVIDASIKNINTGTTGPTEPDPGPTEPDEPDKPIPVLPKLKFSDTTNISNFSVKINDNIYTSDNWTPDLTIDITPGQKLNFEIWADNYYLFDTKPGIAITSNGITKAVTLLPINGKYTGSKSIETTLNNDIILDIRAAASLQPFNEDAPGQPYNPLHPDTPDYINNTYKVWFDDPDMPSRPTDNYIELTPSNRGLYARLPVPAGCKILKLYSTINCDTEIFINNNLADTLTYGQYLYFDNEVNTLDICIPDYTNLMGNINIIYTPRTDITIISSPSNIKNPDNYIAAYTDNPSSRNCTLRFKSTIADESGKYPYNTHSCSIINFFDNDIQPCRIERDYDRAVNIIAIKKEVNN